MDMDIKDAWLKETARAIYHLIKESDKYNPQEEFDNECLNHMQIVCTMETALHQITNMPVELCGTVSGIVANEEYVETQKKKLENTYRED